MERVAVGAKRTISFFVIILCIFLSQVKREITLKVLSDFFYFSIGTGNMGEGGGRRRNSILLFSLFLPPRPPV